MKNNDVLEYFVSKITLLQHKIDDLMVAVSESRHDEILTDSENKKLIAENERLSKELEESEYLKSEYLDNCQLLRHTMVEMYQIVTKNTDGGPKQGVLEDVEAKIDKYEAELGFLRYVWWTVEPLIRPDFRTTYLDKTGKIPPEVGDWFPF